mmetsp:Transcript_9736/g.36218  ORF Transcript_9736/g.36218 Transcript_9736/m.36218 type:complete len:1898 (-) Transcript_9736:3750-9443(-)
MFNSSQHSEKFVDTSDGHSTPPEGLFLDSENERESQRQKRRSSFLSGSMKDLREKLSSRRNSTKDASEIVDPFSIVNAIKKRTLLKRKKKTAASQGERLVTYHLLRRVDFLLSGPTERRHERTDQWFQNRAAIIDQRDNPIRLTGTSLFYFPPSSNLRRFIFHLIFHPLIQFFSFFLTFINVVLYIVKINQPRDTPIHTFYFYFDIFFLFFVGINIACKILAQGFAYGKYTFLQSSIWNLLDLTIFVCSVCSILWLNISVMRGFILLSLVETISFLAPLKAMLDSLTKAISLLRGTVVFLLFVGFIFAVTAVDFFNSSLSRVCVTPDGFKSSPVLHCSKYQGDGLGFVCPGDMLCLESQGNPNNGATSFDNVFNAVVTVFQIVSKSGWSQFYYALVKTETVYLPTVWFVFVIFFVAFVTINLFIVAIKIVFGEFRTLQYETTTLPSFTNFLRNSVSALPSAISSALVHQTFLRQFVHGIIHHKVSRMRQLVRTFTISFLFELFICVTVVVNVLIEVLKQVASLPPNVRFTFELLSNFFLLIYVFEMILKISSIGAIKFFDNKLNQMDFLLISASVVARLSSPNFLNDSADSVGLQILSILRMLRLFGVLYRMRIFQDVMNKVLDSVIPTTILVIFIGIILLAFSTVANQIFTRKLSGFRNYDNMINSFISLFIILTGDAWEESLYQAMSLDANSSENGWVAKILSVPYFLIYWVVSNVLLVSLFIAIVLEAFENNTHLHEASWVSFATQRLYRLYHGIKAQIASRIAQFPLFQPLFERENVIPPQVSSLKKSHASLGSVSSLAESIRPEPKPVQMDEVKKQRIKSLLPRRLTTFWTNAKKFRMLVKEFVSPDGRYNYIFTVFSTITAMIGTFPLFFEKPQEADLSLIRNIPLWLVLYDYTSIIVFGGELLIKFYALGFAAMLDPFNNLDIVMLIELCVTCSFYLIYGLEAKNQLLGGALRGLRALRPLRLLTRLPDFSIYIRATFRGIQDMVQVSILGVSIIFIFALLGVQLFEGMHNYCSDPSMITPLTCTGTYINGKGVVSFRAWRVADQNFNDPLHAMNTLFEMSTRSRWSEVLWPTIFLRDGTENKWNFLYFLFFLLITAFFILNLIIAVIQSSVDAERGIAFLTPTQKSFKKLLQHIVHMRPKRKKRPWTNFPLVNAIFYCVSSRLYKLLQVLAVLIGCIFLALQYGGMDETYKLLVGDIPGYLLCVVFVIDNILQMSAFGIPTWWSKRWNRVDLVLVAFGAVGIAGSGLMKVVQPSSSFLYLTAKGVSRLFLLIRVIRVGTYIPSVKFMLSTLLVCIPSIFSTLVVLLILMFGMAIFGMAFFGNIRFQRVITWDANFRSIFNGMMVLFRVLTLDTWNDLIHDCAIDAPYCTRIPSQFTDCGSRWSIPFYVSFILIGSYCVLNLFIGILLDNFSHTFQTSSFSILQRDLNVFSKVWKDYDPSASGFIPMNQLHVMIQDLYNRKARLGLNLSLLHERELFWVIKYEILDGVKLGGQEDKFYKYVRWNLFQSIKDRLKKLLKKNEKHSTKFSVFFNDVLIALVRVHASIEDYCTETQARRRRLLTRALKSISVMKIQNMVNDRVMKIKLNRLMEKVNQKPQSLVQMKNPLSTQDADMPKSALKNSNLAPLYDEQASDLEAVTLNPDALSIEEDGSNFKRFASYTQYAPEWQDIKDYKFPNNDASVYTKPNTLDNGSATQNDDTQSMKSSKRLQHHVSHLLSSMRSLKGRVNKRQASSPHSLSLEHRTVAPPPHEESGNETHDTRHSKSKERRERSRKRSHTEDTPYGRRRDKSRSTKTRESRLATRDSPPQSVKEAENVDAILSSLKKMKSEFSSKLVTSSGDLRSPKGEGSGGEKSPHVTLSKKSASTKKKRKKRSVNRVKSVKKKKKKASRK